MNKKFLIFINSIGSFFSLIPNIKTAPRKREKSIIKHFLASPLQSLSHAHFTSFICAKLRVFLSFENLLSFSLGIRFVFLIPFYLQLRDSSASIMMEVFFLKKEQVLSFVSCVYAFFFVKLIY